MRKDEQMLKILNKYHSFLNDQLPLQNVLHSELVTEVMYREVIFKSMSDYAAAQAVEFAKWKDQYCEDGLTYPERFMCILDEGAVYYDYNELYDRFQLYLKQQGA